MTPPSFIRIIFFLFRYAYSGHAVAGHAADAGERAVAVLLRLLHLRDRRGATLEGNAASEVLPPG